MAFGILRKWGGMPLDELERKLVAHISQRRGAMLADLAHLVSIPTGHGCAHGLEATRAWMSARLVQLGASMTRHGGGCKPDWLREPRVDSADAGDVIVAARLGAAPTGVRVLLSGHIDTVHDPAGEFRELSGDDAGVRRGPGAADMKGGLIVALAALESLHAMKSALRWSFVLNADEETGSFSSAAHLQAIARNHDIGLVLEPAAAEGSIVTARAGSSQFRIDAHGRAAHAGRDAAKGISAVDALCRAVTKVLAVSDPSVGRTVNVGPLQGGEATNIVPDHAVAWGNARYQSDEQFAEIERALKSIEVGSGDELPRVVVRAIHNRPRKPATREVNALADVAIEVARDLSLTVGTVSTGGVSDSNVLQAAGLPCLDGLGVRGGNLHRSDEFIVVASLTERAAMMAILLHRLASKGCGSAVPCKP